MRCGLSCWIVIWKRLLAPTISPAVAVSVSSRGLRALTLTDSETAPTSSRKSKRGVSPARNTSPLCKYLLKHATSKLRAPPRSATPQNLIPRIYHRAAPFSDKIDTKIGGKPCCCDRLLQL